MTRIAWIGPLPGSQGGVPSMAAQQLIGLANTGVRIEAFVGAAAKRFPGEISARPGVEVHSHMTRWRYDRWYSSTDMTKHVSGAAVRAAQLRRIGASVLARHDIAPFDLVYQFSMPELFAIYGRQRRLPPIVVHPEVHAAGELRWHHRERSLAMGPESAVKHAAVRSMLAGRSAIQRVDLSRADLVIAPAARFGELLSQDYRVAAERIRVVPNPIDVELFEPGEGPRPGEPRRILFVSRIAVRKGVETIVELSHRIADLEGAVLIEVLGDRSLWSDYRHLLDDLNPGTAAVIGHVAHTEMRGRLQGATALLQPSHYEPFALTVAEALACGTPVITSDEVGATENVDPRVGVRVPAGSAVAMERALRDLLRSVEDPATEVELRALARTEAVRLFAPDVVGRQLAGELEAYLATR
jgi:glycosyltransferase involved in cell wall biosynthesis